MFSIYTCFRVAGMFQVFVSEGFGTSDAPTVLDILDMGVSVDRRYAALR